MLKNLKVLTVYAFLRLLIWAFPWKQFHSCANRFERSGRLGKIGVKLVLTDLNRPDWYSREELYEMLALIRREEVKQDWKVPEPC